MSEIAPSSMCAGGPGAIPQTCVRAVTARPAVPTGSPYSASPPRPTGEPRPGRKRAPQATARKGRGAVLCYRSVAPTLAWLRCAAVSEALADWIAGCIEVDPRCCER